MPPSSSGCPPDDDDFFDSRTSLSPVQTVTDCWRSGAPPSPRRYIRARASRVSREVDTSDACLPERAPSTTCVAFRVLAVRPRRGLKSNNASARSEDRRCSVSRHSPPRPCRSPPRPAPRRSTAAPCARASAATSRARGCAPTSASRTRSARRPPPSVRLETHARRLDPHGLRGGPAPDPPRQRLALSPPRRRHHPSARAPGLGGPQAPHPARRQAQPLAPHRTSAKVPRALPAVADAAATHPAPPPPPPSSSPPNVPPPPPTAPTATTPRAPSDSARRNAPRALQRRVGGRLPCSSDCTARFPRASVLNSSLRTRRTRVRAPAPFRAHARPRARGGASRDCVASRGTRRARSVRGGGRRRRRACRRGGDGAPRRDSRRARIRGGRGRGGVGCARGCASRWKRPVHARRTERSRRLGPTRGFARAPRRVRSRRRRLAISRPGERDGSRIRRIDDRRIRLGFRAKTTLARTSSFRGGASRGESGGVGGGDSLARGGGRGDATIGGGGGGGTRTTSRASIGRRREADAQARAHRGQGGSEGHAHAESAVGIFGRERHGGEYPSEERFGRRRRGGKERYDRRFGRRHATRERNIGVVSQSIVTRAGVGGVAREYVARECVAREYVAREKVTRVVAAVSGVVSRVGAAEIPRTRRRRRRTRA